MIAHLRKTKRKVEYVVQTIASFFQRGNSSKFHLPDSFLPGCLLGVGLQKLHKWINLSSSYKIY